GRGAQAHQGLSPGEMVHHANHIEAEWRDKSQLNKYLLYHKPTKVFSPEYLGDERMLCQPPFLRKLQ
ncbi:hypothetical protein NG726_41015, partial [Pseudomonas sp. MOB-449]|nr:hypothetical protein [Pseudomonas sp. MOB-449]